ncbi:MAG TPA: bifunctional (p)ppGpp synthetase/guanosine-3',5'-bis(diphosphate) 3'-pyrophosphohydrolase [Dehalococcoidia bacterium]|nr:bifunctional (p)ppGpp synthetase/guanosine-3',5'-bis(diphosphate) 3'-pyrophosphohydrolase [Dehalococcoidia bacterium]
MKVHEAELGQELLAKVGEYLPPKGVTLVREALEFASECHAGQLRKSGDPVITHPLHAATTIASLQLDADTIAAALLHDVQEDCDVTNDALAKRFGGPVATLVEGVTKLGRIPWQASEVRPGYEAIQAENLRKMFLAMSQDLRVVIIKLADRQHNMLTLWALPPDDQRRIAKETMEIYAPLAARLGIWELKWRLEDLAFRYLHPERYKLVADMLDAKREAREQYVAQVTGVLRQELAAHGLEAEVAGRAKHIFSIYQKTEKYASEGKSVDEIYDLVAVRVLVETVADCYNALGVAHGLWRPLPGTFDDYIASPKESTYQSLHSTVMGPGGHPLEVQIRTYEMHRMAEYGIAAHWRYKEGSKRDLRYEERLAWLRQLLEWHREMSQAEELVEAVKTDIFQDQVFVFTPKGEIKDLPTGSTPLDFAYRVHTELGHLCVGSKVNGRLVPLNYELQNGDSVEILTSRSSKGPSRDWLNPHLGYIRTSHARGKIRQWFKRQEREENIARGKEMLEKELHRLGTTLPVIQEQLLKLFNYEEPDDFFLQVGYGDISTQQVATKLAPLLQEEEGTLETAEPPARATYTTSVRVLGTGDLLTRLARCCNPVPGDPIVGYVTRGEGVSVHRRNCRNITHEDERERLVDVEWGRRGHLYPVAVRIEAWDRVGLLRDVSTMVAEERVNMVGVHTQEQEDGLITIFVTLETAGIEQLTRLLSKLEGVRGVLSVGRRLEGAPKRAQ